MKNNTEALVNKLLEVNALTGLGLKVTVSLGAKQPLLLLDKDGGTVTEQPSKPAMITFLEGFIAAWETQPQQPEPSDA